MSRRSDKVLLPWSMWAMIEKLRICIKRTGNLTRAIVETRPAPTDRDLVARPEVASAGDLVGFVLNDLRPRASRPASSTRAPPLSNMKRGVKLGGIGFVLND